MLTKNNQLDQETANEQVLSADQNQRTGPELLKRTARGLVQFVVMVAILFAGIYGMNRLTALKEEGASRPPFKTVYTVESVIAERGNFQPSMLVYGEIQAAKTTDLRPLVTGKIIDINPDLKVGAQIEEGEVLFRIDPFAFETALATARSNAAETRARITENEAMIRLEKSRIKNLNDQLQIAQNDLDRISQLRSRGTATAKDVEDRTLVVSQRTQSLEQSRLTLVAEEARLEQQKNVLERLNRAVVQAERDLADTVLYAPVTGIISVNNAAIGRYIGPNDQAVSLWEVERLEVRFTLTDQRFGRIQSDKTGVIGREVEVIWTIGSEEFRYPAKIDRIGAQIVSNRGGVEVIAVIEGEVGKNALRPGAFVEIIVPDREFENRVKLPETALYEGNTVYEIVDGKLQGHEVRVLARQGDEVILTAGFENGSEILATKIAEISEGIKVRTDNRSGSDASTLVSGNSEQQ